MARPTIRCKLRVAEVSHIIEADGSVGYETVKLSAVYGQGDSENAHWSRWTPNASFSITISNPDAFGKLTKDHEFYVDFTPAHVQEQEA